MVFITLHVATALTGIQAHDTVQQTMFTNFRSLAKNDLIQKELSNSLV